MKNLILSLLGALLFMGVGAQVQPVTLDGSKSTDPDGHIVKYKWAQVGTTPNLVTIASDTSVKTTMVPSGGLQWAPGTYIIQLTVTDDQGASTTGQTHVTWTATSPSVSAGLDQTVQLPITGVNLKATGLVTFGKAKSWTWTQISGPNTAVFNRKDTSIATVSGLISGVYNFQIAIVDLYNQVGTDQVTVVVKNANTPPKADAGLDQSIQLPTSSVSIGGMDSPDGSQIRWVKVSGPAGDRIQSPAASFTRVSNLSRGVFTYQKTVRTPDGQTATDRVVVTVKRRCSWIDQIFGGCKS